MRVCLFVSQNAELKFSFGGEDFKNQPKGGFVALDQAPEGHVVKSSQTGVWMQTLCQMSQATILNGYFKILHVLMRHKS